MPETPPSTARKCAVEDFLIRPMSAADLPASQALSHALRWPHRQADWVQAFAHAQGFVGERSGQVVATAQRWLWGDRMATVGMVVVAADCRGLGLGRAVMRKLLRGLDRHTVVLQATRQGEPLYGSLGFEEYGHLRQHQGIARPTPLMTMKAGRRLRPAGTQEIDSLAALDALASGMQRHALIASLLKAAVDCVVLDEDGEAHGFALLRRFGHGLLVGPVVAPDLEGAKTLIAHLVGQSAGCFARLDVNSVTGLSGWLDEIGLPVADTATSMRRGAAPLLLQAAPQMFAVASQALC